MLDAASLLVRARFVDLIRSGPAGGELGANLPRLYTNAWGEGWRVTAGVPATASLRTLLLQDVQPRLASRPQGMDHCYYVVDAGEAPAVVAPAVVAPAEGAMAVVEAPLAEAAPRPEAVVAVPAAAAQAGASLE